METSNLVLAFVAVGAAALVLGFEWFLAFRARLWKSQEQIDSHFRETRRAIHSIID
jgi:hypothetical protein